MTERITDARLRDLIAAVDGEPAATLLTHPKDMESALRELSERRERERWIPVAERLPEPGAAVLVRARHKNGMRTSVGHWVTGDRWSIDGVTGYGVPEPVCWMPLPEIGPLPRDEADLDRLASRQRDPG